ncbi:histidinol-phosphate transaminase [Verrucosispora sp. WMMA2044]|uniref:Histidinol-phosphate aminotransferase n=1 Tax=Verrucosispora sioxanthis TaxID=2499994 RepID=A0A6M1LAS7_9ACTN|nr:MULTISPECIES: histidinol-phosphate transaminase [Micromonospora]NEE66189.1 histidinol-phosphate transaminase [Verrucosispora sioxanthis]NGM15299.1 histidinol-phosphate transaminase [Verrucosispora sioxanthis]WBB49964.1 histidinol-phosphate transaminase [Verrucosispora sp. WMMA2044]
MTGLDDLPIRDDLRGRSPYGAPQLDVPVRLNTNENSHPVPEAVAEAIGKALTAELRDLNRYPDRDALALRADLAGYLGHGLTADGVWAANGSNEVQQQLLQAFGGPGRSALGFTPAYSMHPLLALGTGTRWVPARRGVDFALTADEAVAQVREHRPDVVFLCSPNNPTGTALDPTVIRAVLDVAPGMVVVDEAYAEFARPGTVSALAVLPGHPRLVVTRTMSKAFGFAGGRLGYLAADPAVVAAVQLVRLPYHLSALTQAAARAALAHRDALLATVAEISEQRDRIVAELRRRGLRVADSDANFVLYEVGGDQSVAWRALLARGVLVRDVGLPGWLRVTAGTRAETDAFLAAVHDIQREGLIAPPPLPTKGTS